MQVSLPPPPFLPSEEIPDEEAFAQLLTLQPLSDDQRQLLKAMHQSSALELSPELLVEGGGQGQGDAELLDTEALQQVIKRHALSGASQVRHPYRAQGTVLCLWEWAPREVGAGFCLGFCLTGHHSPANIPPPRPAASLSQDFSNCVVCDKAISFHRGLCPAAYAHLQRILPPRSLRTPSTGPPKLRGA